MELLVYEPDVASGRSSACVTTEAPEVGFTGVGLLAEASSSAVCPEVRGLGGQGPMCHAAPPTGWGPQKGMPRSFVFGGKSKAEPLSLLLLWLLLLLLLLLLSFSSPCPSAAGVTSAPRAFKRLETGVT